MVYPKDDVPLRLRLLTNEVNRLREKLWSEVERAKAAREAARRLVLLRESQRAGAAAVEREGATPSFSPPVPVRVRTRG